MRRLGRFKWIWPPTAERQAGYGPRRDRVAVLLAFATVVCLGSVFLLSKGTPFLMPGPLASAHGAIESCGACHTKSGSGKLSWIHGLVAGDPLADSKACLTCHKMPDTAFNAHSAPADVLKQSTERLAKIAAKSPAPQSARAQSFAFPTHEVVARGLYCATCHQEHQGTNFNLNKISNEQCRSCHEVKFDSFDGNHPKFDNYPFKRRTRIVYDHAAHFGKHYPEVAKKDPARRIPATCSTCHNSRDDKRIMAVAPFEETCAACHLDQITGKERVSGPKGIAFLALPGLDLQSMKKKNAAIGEWPDESEAALTPFMKVMISRSERGRALIKTVDSLNLQDLTEASDDQIKAVTELVREIKTLFFSLVSGKASDVLGNLNIEGGTKLSANFVSDLAASIPRDVVITAQQRWLPNLAAEMANGPGTSDRQQDGWSPVTTEPVATSETDASGSAFPEETSQSDAGQETPKGGPPAAVSEEANTAKRDPQACIVRLLGQCLLSKAPEEKTEAAPSKEAAGLTDTANAKPNGGKETPSARELPGAMRAGLKDAGQTARPGAQAGKTDTANAKPRGTVFAAAASKAGAEEQAAPAGRDAAAAADKDSAKAAESEAAAGKVDAPNAKPEGGIETLSADKQPKGKATDQSDDLLFPTEEEQREIKARNKDSGKGAQPDKAPAGAAADRDTAPANPQTKAAPAMTVESDVDPESWAEYGGWYQQDYAIFYRPAGHKDKFITSWLTLTGPQAPKGGTSPPAAVFDFLTSKDAQGSCVKCHSVDDIQGKGRIVNFSPLSVERKQGRFTRFIHEPHFGVIGTRGCLTCHDLEKDLPGAAAIEADTANAKPDDTISADTASKANAAAPAEAQAGSGATAASTDAEKGVSPYLKSYEQSNPHNFVSEFSAVKKDNCQTCHTSSMARQDCLLCHKYHVNDVITPITNTKLPTQ